MLLPANRKSKCGQRWELALVIEPLIRYGLYMVLLRTPGFWNFSKEKKHHIAFIITKSLKQGFQDIAITQNICLTAFKSLREKVQHTLLPLFRDYSSTIVSEQTQLWFLQDWEHFFQLSISLLKSLQLLLRFSFSRNRNDAAHSLLICLTVWGFIRAQYNLWEYLCNLFRRHQSLLIGNSWNHEINNSS